ncbi:MAG: Lrp/AsnC family transcriptional regulator [Thermodesulfobacterium geofontis]|uniref:siroheme decarboxylase n=1 Tax=Thermodesulfobacterium geofontis TaxID=1295609 RepID=A0A2N7QF52_9BACT|nr:MAG: Lrp/AsnC family transcriptional regulator [Thermodesulfobacterium geofontis]
MEKISEEEKKVLKYLIEGIPITKRPFLEIAKKTGLKEEDVLEIIKNLLKKKVIRRIGTTLRHNLAGIKGNAMVAWKVPEEKVEEIGRYLSKLPYVSHCYVRKTYREWNYNLYTMIHGKNKSEVKKRIRKISEEIHLTEYQILFTKKEIVRKHAKYEI